jgi:hypothetical protein
LMPSQVRIFVTVVTQEEVDLHFGVYERMLAEKISGLAPIGRIEQDSARLCAQTAAQDTLGTLEFSDTVDALRSKS